MFNPIAELVILIGIPTKEAKVEMQTHSVNAETKISKCSMKCETLQTFYASYSSIYFGLFLQ